MKSQMTYNRNSHKSTTECTKCRYQGQAMWRDQLQPMMPKPGGDVTNYTSGRTERTHTDCACVRLDLRRTPENDSPKMFNTQPFWKYSG